MTVPDAKASCPSDAELIDLAEGRLGPAEVARLKLHAAGCSACGILVAALMTGGRERSTPHVGDESLARMVVGDLRTPELGGDPAARLEDPGTIAVRGAAIGRYLVLSLIGRGGMGEVYAAYDPELHRRVAVKLLHVARGSESARKRLSREARALGRLSHPNVVQVHDVGEHEGDVFVAMELVIGQPLDAFCKGPPAPGWEDVLAAYIDAARGLGAAHEKGIVHRDVKPTNILRGEDGRVRVADFGLAASGDDASPDAAQPSDPGRDEEVRSLVDVLPAPSASDDLRTTTGRAVGTPLYMAPEQLEGARASPASDQHSLCTALYEGLYGALPFDVRPGPGLVARLLKGKKQGPPPSPPPGSKVPARVHAAIVRGLAPRPEDRFPSMAALVVALTEARGASRRPLARAAAAFAVAILAVAAAARGAFVDPCAHPERQLAGAWDAGVRARVRAALVESGRGYAADTATRVEALLDRYGEAWSTMRGEVCRARRSGAARREIADLRDECLDRRLRQVQALTAVLSERPDADVLDKATAAAAALPPVAYCADTEALTARVRPPEDPAVRARVEALLPRVDRLDALLGAAKYPDAAALAEPLLADARALPFPPLAAQVAYAAGRAREGKGDLDGAKDLLREASVAAAEGHDDVLAASAWARLLYIVGEEQRRLDEAATIRALGPTVVARAGDPRTEAAWLGAEGLTLGRMGKLPEAVALEERALAILERVLPPDHLDLAATRGDLGRLLFRMGKTADALAMHEKALAVQEAALGADHPDVADSLDRIGSTYLNTGDYARALETYERALAIKERALGPDHHRVAATLTNAALAHVRLGDPRQAIPLYERALAIDEKALGAEHPGVANILLNLAAAETATGDDARAKVTLMRAISIDEKALGPDHPDLATARLSLGSLLEAMGEPAAAAAALEQGIAGVEKALGPDDPRLIGALTSLCRVHTALGHFDAARATVDRALALADRSPGSSADTRATPFLALGELHLARHAPAEAAAAYERFLALGATRYRSDADLGLANALWLLGRDRPRARALAGEARALRERRGDMDGVAEVDGWLAAHPAPPR